jgi:hypothetical protein
MNPGSAVASAVAAATSAPLSRGRLGLLFVLALAVRLVYVAQDYPVPAQDTPDYDELARNLLAGNGLVASQHWFGVPLKAWRPPFYPGFLAAVYASVGTAPVAVKVCQCLVGAATVVLVCLIAWHLRPRLGLAVGGLAAVYGPLVASANEIMSETWFTFWVVLSVWLLLRVGAPDTARRRRWLAGGAAIGLATLTRPVGLLLWPACAWVACRQQGWQGARRVAWVAVAAFLVLLPWAWRNHQVLGSWVPLSSQGGFILARSNAAEPAWRQADGWGIDEGFFRRYPDEVERDRYWRQQAIDYIRSHPGHYARLVLERFLRFWYFLRPDYNFWFMLVLPWAVAGWWRHGRQPETALLSWTIAVQVLAFSLVLYGSTRFRLPLEPLFLVFAGLQLDDTRERWGQRRLLVALIVLVVLNLAAVWSQEGIRGQVLQVLGQGGLK